MNTKEKFIKIFEENDILSIGRNSKITKELIIEAFTENYDNKTPLHIALGYSSSRAASKGLSRAITLDKPCGLYWPKYLLDTYFPPRKWTKQDISVSATVDRVEYDKQYASLNKSIKNANSKRRKLAKINRTPQWANLEKIKLIYINCPEGYHVDHIIPLQGELVSGLHVENNLQYLTAEENLKKGNKYVPVA